MGCSFEFAVGKSCGVVWDDGLGQAEGTVHVTKSRVMRMGWDGTRSCEEGMRG